MKTVYKISASLLLILLCLLYGHQRLFACVQEHDSVYVSVHYETPGNTDVSITLTNLRLASGTPNEFCSCGITSVTSTFSTILYVAFVDSGTTNPIPGFDIWNPSVPAANAWNNVLATNDWSAFVSHVNTNGLQLNRPVELIIRARLAPGYTYQYVDSALTFTYLGTDAYDNTNQVLGNMHQDVSGILGPHVMIPEGPGSTYFATLDAALMTHRAEPQAVYALDIYPVPARDRVTVSLPNPQNVIERIEIYDIQGKLVFSQADLKSCHQVVDVATQPDGIYFLKVQTSDGIQTRKFVKTR